MNTEKFRFESGSVYEFCDKQKAYVFIGKLNGRTKKQFIADYENERMHADDHYYDDAM